LFARSTCQTLSEAVMLNPKESHYYGLLFDKEKFPSPTKSLSICLPEQLFPAIDEPGSKMIRLTIKFIDDKNKMKNYSYFHRPFVQRFPLSPNPF
jgi:hypothetical protein